MPTRILALPAGTAFLLLAACTAVVQPPPQPRAAADMARLMAVYGPPSQAAFGSAVFHQALASGDTLEQAALGRYQYFVGELWERWGEDAWMGPWQEVYARPAGARPDIVAELRAIDDANARLSVPMILDVVQDNVEGQAALAAVFDDPAVTELRVFTIGDGAAMSGLLIAAARAVTGDGVFLVFLLD